MNSVALLAITIPGVPIAQPRHRVAIRGKHVGRYLPSAAGGGPHPVVAWKATIRSMVAERVDSSRCALEAGPVAVAATLFFPRPQSRTRKREPNLPYPHATRPDVENCGKALLDALTGVLWVDDAQVADLRIVKIVCGDGESPRTELAVDRLI